MLTSINLENAGMPGLNIPFAEAQNRFGFLLDTAQNNVVTVTRDGQAAAYVMSPQLLEDHIDAQLAMEAEAEGFLSVEESKACLDKFRHV